MADTEPVMDREPVRVTQYLAAAVVALATFCGAMGLVDDITAKAMFAAAGLALGEFAVIAFAAEVARSRAWSPVSVQPMLDAEMALAPRG